MSDFQFVTRQAVDHPTFSAPPIDGSLHIAEVYDYNGEHSSNHPAFVYMEQDIRTTITWSHLCCAIKRATVAIQKALGTQPPSVIALLANLDTITYSTLLMGITRAGHQPFLISTRHSAATVAHLLQQTRSKYLIVGDTPTILRLATAACALPSLGGIVGDSITTLKPPTFDDLFHSTHLDLPLNPVAHIRPNDIALIIHSSGTTSPLPKISRLSYLALWQWGLLPYYGNADLSRHTLSAHSLHPSHGASILSVAWMVSSGLTLAVLSPSQWTPEPDADSVLDGALRTGCSIMLTVPWLLEGWARTPQCVHALKEFDAVVYTGAPLKRQAGAVLWANGVKLSTYYGATELGCVTSFLPSFDDDYGLPNAWEYFRFSPHCRPKLIPQDDDVYHLLFTECDTHSLNVVNVECSDFRYFDSQDLVIQHPVDPKLWRICGRANDVIHHPNGSKTNPVPLEDIISQHPLIQSCLVFGHGHRVPGLLVVPSPQSLQDSQDPHILDGFIDHIWSAVDEANRSCPEHSRIKRDSIMIASPTKPFKYTRKMTIDRTTVLREYEEEIEALYNSLDPDSPIEPSMPVVLKEKEALHLVRMAVERYISHPLSDDDDLFQAGCDSSQATWIRNVVCNVLHYNLKLSTRNIPHNVVYINPTIRRLGLYITHVMRYGQAAMALCDMSGRIREMEDMVKKYSVGFERTAVQSYSKKRKRPREVVLLTGSTGSLGSHLLEMLIKDRTVDHVYALNRPDSKGYRSVYVRQATSFKDRNLDYCILNSDKLQLLEGNLADECFGLDEDVYEEMMREVTCIIHNSWSLKIDTALSSLEPLIAGTRRLIDFALCSAEPIPPRFVFVGTLTYMNWQSGRLIPESPNKRPATALGTGYTESKWIAENVLVNASQQTNLPVSIIRVGQLSGGPNGSWNAKEWLPSLIRSAQVVQCLPNPSGVLSWMPVHLAAAAIIEMRHSGSAFMNLSHPDPVSATVVFTALADALQVPLVGYSEWLVTLEASMRVGTSLASMPLLDFYRAAYRPSVNTRTEAFGMALAATNIAMRAAPTARRRIAQLGRTDVDSWVRYWRQIGLLTQK